MTPPASPPRRAGTWLSVALLLLVAATTALAARDFATLHRPSPLVIRDAVTQQRQLSDYFPALRGTPGDTPVYILEGAQPGGTLLLLGGVHPNEPAGMLAAVVALENALVDAGRLIVVPITNASAITHNAAGHATPQGFDIPTAWGSRHFRLGDRLSNPLHQYPDPEVHLHHPSGSLGSGQEARNLNRNFPGRPDGTLTERIAYGVQQLIHQEKVDLLLDLHEARPMNPIVDAVVAHEDAADVAAIALIDMEAFEDLTMRLEITPKLFQGVSQRELGDHTEALAVLSETANIAMDYVHGRMGEELVLTGRDEYLARAALHPGLVYVAYDPEFGLPIDDRVGRHLSVFNNLVVAYNDFFPDRAVRITGIPSHADVLARGTGSYLLNPATGGTR